MAPKGELQSQAVPKETQTDQDENTGLVSREKRKAPPSPCPVRVAWALFTPGITELPAASATQVTNFAPESGTPGSKFTNTGLFHCRSGGDRTVLASVLGPPLTPVLPRDPFHPVQQTHPKRQGPRARSGTCCVGRICQGHEVKALLPSQHVQEGHSAPPVSRACRMVPECASEGRHGHLMCHGHC